MKFSVIVPIFEHWELIPKLLACLERQTIPKEQFEILLVDNGSSYFFPPTSLPVNAKILKILTPGSYAARNHGTKQAQGEWLVFTDADCLPEPNWLWHYQQAISKLPDHHFILAGLVNVISDSNSPTFYEIYELVKGIPQQEYVQDGYGATANLAVPQQAFRTVGAFDANRYSSGDAEFGYRASNYGYKVIFVPEAIVNHPTRKTWQAVARKSRRLIGGQVAVGSLQFRIISVLRLLNSVVSTPVKFGLARDHPLKYRLVASGVFFCLWWVQLAELVRLLSGATAERR